MQLKFITINIQNGGLLIEKVVAFISNEKPDILFLQETFADHNKNLPNRLRSLFYLKEKSGLKHSSFAPAFHDLDDHQDRGNGILSKFQFISEKAINYITPYKKFHEQSLDPDFRLSPRILQNNVVKIQNKDLRLLNIHGAWDFHGNDTEVRIKQSQMILSEFSDNESIILAGDFNMNPKTKAINMLEEKLESVFNDSLKTSFNMKRKSNPALGNSVVDMIFVSKDIKILDKYCPQVDISDHLPLVAILEVS